MRLLFWISPILWSFSAVVGRGARLQDGLLGVDRFLSLPEGTMFAIISYNPVAMLLDSYRLVIYGGLGTNEAGQLIWTPATQPNWALLAAIFVTGIVIIFIGTLVFKRLEPAFAKVL